MTNVGNDHKSPPLTTSSDSFQVVEINRKNSQKKIVRRTKKKLEEIERMKEKKQREIN